MISRREYGAIHTWLRNKYGSASLCENQECPQTSRSFAWALTAGKKHDRIRENYWQACLPCHRAYDKRHANFGISTGVKRDELDSVNIRISEKAYNALKKRAKSERRSLTAVVEILAGV